MPGSDGPPADARGSAGACARGPRLVLAAVLILGAGPAAAAWQSNGYVTIASDYVYRGVSMLEDGVSVQGGVEARANDTFVAGAWATNVDRQWGYGRGSSDRLEANLYTGVDLGCGAQCRMRVLVTGYVYTGPDAHDWQEVSASVAWRERVGAAVSFSPRGLGVEARTRTLDAWFVQPLARSTSVEIAAGEMWIGQRDYWFGRVGLMQRLDRWQLALNYYVSDPAYRRYGLDDRSRRLVVALSTAF